MSKASAKANFKKAVAKAKQLYKSGRYASFADAVKAAYKGAKVGSTKKVVKSKKVKRKKPHKTWGVVKKHERRVSGVNNASAATLTRVLLSRKKETLGKQLLRREMATRKTDRRKISKLISATKADIRKLS